MPVYLRPTLARVWVTPTNSAYPHPLRLSSTNLSKIESPWLSPKQIALHCSGKGNIKNGRGGCQATGKEKREKSPNPPMKLLWRFERRVLPRKIREAHWLGGQTDIKRVWPIHFVRSSTKFFTSRNSHTGLLRSHRGCCKLCRIIRDDPLSELVSNWRI